VPPIPDQLDTAEQAETADIADHRVPLLQPPQPRQQVGAHLVRVADKVVVPYVAEDGGAGGARQGVARGVWPTTNDRRAAPPR
jgi:hypothetical protein